MKQFLIVVALVFVVSIPASATTCEHWTSVLLNAGNAYTQQVVTGVPAKQIRICSLTLFSAGGATVELIEGVGGNCATGTLGMIGGSAAQTGMILSPNLFLGQATNGLSGVVTSTVNAADDVCLTYPNGGQITGVISWTQL